jgi:hypothetical protein
VLERVHRERDHVFGRDLTAEAPRPLAWRTISPRVVHGSELLGRVYALLVPGHRDRDKGLHDDLLRIGEVAGATPVAATACPTDRLTAPG